MNQRFITQVIRIVVRCLTCTEHAVHDINTVSHLGLTIICEVLLSLFYESGNRVPESWLVVESGLYSHVFCPP